MRNLEGTILEHRETRGGKYALVMREYAHGLYDLMAYDRSTTTRLLCPTEKPSNYNVMRLG